LTEARGSTIFPILFLDVAVITYAFQELKKNLRIGKHMFAVIRTGGKQYKVTNGDTIAVEKLDGALGDTIVISDILMVDSKLGAAIKSAKVMAEIVRQFRDEKVIIFKKRRRHNYRRKKGHRQYLTEIKITDIAA